MKKLLSYFSVSIIFTFSPCLANALKVGLVLDNGGKDDKSFNASAYAGATKAEKELGIELKYVEALDINSFEPLLRGFAAKKFDLIIGIGFAQADAIKKIATQFPDRKFAIVDSEVKAPNVKSLMFAEHEGSYLVGALAALKTKGKIGFIGGMDIPLIRRFELAYIAGARKINPKIEVVSNFVGITSEAWNNPAKAKELALAQYHSGVDIIFLAAGASANGAFDATEETKKYAIGVDSNQNWIKPGHILTSMLKRVDLAVYETIKEAKEGKLSAGTKYFDLKAGGIDYAVDDYNKALLDPATLNKVEDIKKQIINKKISPPDFYKKTK